MKKVFMCLIFMIYFSGCSKTGKMMYDTKYLIKPSQDTSVITFVRPAGRAGMSMWEGKEFIGFLYGASILQIETTPGKHIYIAPYKRRAAILSCDLLPGKQYLVVAKTYHGAGAVFRSAHDTPQNKVDSWFNRYRFIQPNTGKYKDDFAAYEVNHGHIAERYLEQIDNQSFRILHLQPEEYFMGELKAKGQ